MARRLGMGAAGTPLMSKRLGALGAFASYLVLCTLHASAEPLSRIAGTVAILDRDGNELVDRSGVVVFLDGTSLAGEFKTTPEMMSHKGRRFSPEILPVMRGTTIDFLNDDDIYHNVFSLSVAKPFDLGIYPEGTSKVLTFDQPGLVRIYCNLHPEMVSTILVLNNGLFAKTNTEGEFQINEVPDGSYTLRLWYEYADEQARPVSVSGSAALEENFTVEITKRRRKHKNKFGKPYRQKY